MKKTLLILLCVFGLSIAASAKVKRVVNITRDNGLFGYYSDLYQVFVGWYPDGTESWILDCRNPGFVRCRLRPTAGKTTRDAEMEDVENAKLDDLMLSIESNQISTGITSGSMVKHYQATLSDNSTIDIYINISWAPNTDRTGSTTFSAEITDIG